jgi:two-component system cell cycle response regulator
MSGGGALVLIGEDSTVVREVLRWHLETDGFRIAECADGIEALELASKLRPDVILLGVELATIDGLVVLERMKANPELADIPVVFVTARTTTDDLVEGLRLGAHDYLFKPFEPAEVVARVRSAARISHLQEALRRRNAELERISRSDSLTGLPNRREIDDQLASMLASGRRHGDNLAVAMIDIDHFKAINDTYGHAAGDAVLQEVARRLRDAARQEDLVGRWGGEEFMALLPRCDGTRVFEVCDRIRSAVAATPVDLPEGGSLDVTVSIGCTPGLDDEMVQRADTALYTAKQEGRNRTIAFRTPELVDLRRT